MLNEVKWPSELKLHFLRCEYFCHKTLPNTVVSPSFLRRWHYQKSLHCPYSAPTKINWIFTWVGNQGKFWVLLKNLIFSMYGGYQEFIGASETWFCLTPSSKAPSSETLLVEGSLPMVEVWNEMIFEVPSNPNHSVKFMSTNSLHV